MDEKVEFGDLIKRARLNRNLSLRKAGELIDISYSHLSKLERGIFNSTPQLRTLKNISDEYDLNFDKLAKLNSYSDSDIKEFHKLKNKKEIKKQQEMQILKELKEPINIENTLIDKLLNEKTLALDEIFLAEKIKISWFDRTFTKEEKKYILKVIFEFYLHLELTKNK